MLTSNGAGKPLRELCSYLKQQPASERLYSSGLLGSGAAAQLAAAGHLLEGSGRELFEEADAVAEGIGAAPALVIVLRELGFLLNPHET